MSQTFRKKIEPPVSVEKAFAWHERRGAFSRLTPPWENVKLISAEGGIRDGARVEVRVHALGPIRFNAVYRHLDYIEGKQFVDIQEKGPFRKWRHEHRFHSLDTNRCVLEDHIDYQAPHLAEGLISNR